MLQARTPIVAIFVLGVLRAFVFWGLLSLGLMGIGADRTSAFIGAFLWMIVMAPMIYIWRRKRTVKAD